MSDLGLEIHPLTPERWADFETAMGSHGAYGGCWCMYWRLNRKEFAALHGEGTKQAMHNLVDGGEQPGLVGYLDGRPVGWVAVAPRASFPVLNNSRILKPVDEQPVWSVNCFYVVRGYRRQGASVALLKAAVQFAAEHGAQIVEGYPNDIQKGDYPAPYIYTGTLAAFQQAGFVEVARRSEHRPIMRYYLVS